MGGLSRAALPAIPGSKPSRPAFHSQQWDHDYPLEGKRVAVIGTGAARSSSCRRSRHRWLDLFQRTPPWIMPKPDRDVRARALDVPHAAVHAEAGARGLYWMLESRVLGFAMHPSLMKNVQKIALRHIRKQTPTGCARPSRRTTRSAASAC
jgi:cation diffusion facilitator CzcD-associated flavoprotein CzcO